MRRNRYLGKTWKENRNWIQRRNIYVLTRIAAGLHVYYLEGFHASRFYDLNLYIYIYIYIYNFTILRNRKLWLNFLPLLRPSRQHVYIYFLKFGTDPVQITCWNHLVCKFCRPSTGAFAAFRRQNTRGLDTLGIVRAIMRWAQAAHFHFSSVIEQRRHFRTF